MSLLKSGSLTLAAGLSQQVFAMLLFLLAVRWLSPADLGQWAMALTLGSLVEVARMGLVQNALIHFLHKSPEDQVRLWTTAVVLSITASLLGGLVITIFAIGLQSVWEMPQLPLLCAGYTLVVLFFGLVRLRDTKYAAQNQFRPAVVSQIMFGFLLLSMLTAWYFTGLPLTAGHLMVLQIAAAFVNFASLYILDGDCRSFRFPGSQHWEKFWEYGRYGLGTNLFSTLLQRLDMLLLGVFAGPATVAAYNVASRFITYLDWPLNSLSTALFPGLAAALPHQDAQQKKQLYNHTIATLLAVTLPLLIFTFLAAPWLVEWLASGKYSEAAPVLRLLLLAGLFKPFGRALGLVLDASGTPQWNFRILLLSALITLIANLILIPAAGLTGAALAATGAITFTIVLSQWLFKKHWSLRLLLVFRHFLHLYGKLLYRVLEFLETPFILKVIKKTQL